ncbi:MAG: hypothetical protein JWO19_3610 [Bryobacterales bacterium]|nr:hypothetical protein [Bryobacterales bacterium]
MRFELRCAIVHPLNRTCSNVTLETDDDGEQRALRRPDSMIQSQQATQPLISGVGPLQQHLRVCRANIVVDLANSIKRACVRNGRWL